MSFIFSVMLAHHVQSTCLSGVCSHVGPVSLLLAVKTPMCLEHWPRDRMFSPMFPARRLWPKHRKVVFICFSRKGGLQTILHLLQLSIPSGFSPRCCLSLGNASFLL